MPDDFVEITPALSNFLSALTITDLVIPVLSAILLATRIPSVPSLLLLYSRCYCIKYYNVNCCATSLLYAIWQVVSQSSNHPDH